MKCSVALVTLPVACMAARVARRAPALPEGGWTAGVWRPSSDGRTPIWGDGISASASKFFLYKETSAYCPGNITNLDCSAYPGKSTVFVDGNNTVSLDVSMPGGLQGLLPIRSSLKPHARHSQVHRLVYIAPDGALSYTVPHSAYMPNGSVTTGFQRYTSPAGGAPVIWGIEGRAWYMCPLSSNETKPVYQIYLISGGREGCLGIEMRTYGHANLVAWEYA